MYKVKQGYFGLSKKLSLSSRLPWSQPPVPYSSSAHSRLFTQHPSHPNHPSQTNSKETAAASNWLHQMTLYLTLSGLLGTAHAIPHAVSFLIGAARTWWRAQEGSGSPPTTWTTVKAAFLEAFQTLDAKRIARDNMENLRQRTSVTNYANQFSGLPLEVSHMHSADAIYKVVKGLKPQIRLHVELQRPSTVNDAMRLAQAADSALYYTRPTVDRQSDQTCQSSL